MRGKQSSKSVILVALSANLFIAVIKFFVAALTASSAMLAEAVHSVADTMNQVFLLIGIKRGRRDPDSLHPFGFASELYFWSFIVAIILFTAGAIFSIYKGIQKVLHPEPLDHVEFAFAVLIFSMLAEGIAFLKAFRKIQRERRELSIVRYLRQCKKSELIVVFLEDLAAITGLGVALILLLIQYFTGILILDGIASIIIGIILGVVALFLGNEVKSLLIGESADPMVLRKIKEIFASEESITRVIYMKSLQLGPDDILLAVKAEFNKYLSTSEISTVINGIEAEIRQRYPEMKKIFIEPDMYVNNF
jgi:cation diffusion facilitator family transporter